MSDVELRAVRKTFLDAKGVETVVLDDVNIRARSGEFVVLLGPSGCGKSTSLRLIAGLESASSGDILIDGQRVNHVPASRRKIAMVFQNYALYPHLSVMENIVFGLRVRKVPRAEREARGRAAAEKLGLTPYLDRKPAQLSGGQRQRAALGRALVTDAKVVLMDEPLSNLDAKLRHHMRVELRDLQRDLGLTVIYVTHDQVEAMTMADHVAVMRGGRVVQAADPVTLYRDPDDAEIASFIGSPPMNLVPGIRVPTGIELGRAEGVPTTLELDAPGSPGDSVILGVRPESVRLQPVGRGVELIGRVHTVEILGAETLVTAELADGTTIVTRLPGIVRIDTGDPIRLHAALEDLHFFDQASGERLREAGGLRDQATA